MKRDYRQQTWDAEVEDDCRQLVRLAVREDLDTQQDWTTLALVDPDRRGAASIVPRESGTICGLQAAQTAIQEMESALVLEPLVEEGAPATPGEAVAVIRGAVRDMLTCERIALNLIGRLSGVASLTAKFVAAAKRGGHARVYDTRKTTPGWRRLEKFAVRCGGGMNHRMGLFDGVLIKDNHLAAGGAATSGEWNAADAVRKARELIEQLGEQRKTKERLMLEIEVDTLAQLRQALDAKPDIILLDNMTPDLLREAVQLRNEYGSQSELEASGSVTLATISGISASGVERISVGAITHSAVALDVGLDWNLNST